MILLDLGSQTPSFNLSTGKSSGPNNLTLRGKEDMVVLEKGRRDDEKLKKKGCESKGAYDR
ncbi:F-box protein [Corchorus olitorius]|uniref:F-box protein n=1 Tax=Corchorus olitorius TaxID=93759 RepID=A0A1R3ITA0_9ROSI|nr:F-box protein [Corchorus olitorius]